MILNKKKFKSFLKSEKWRQTDHSSQDFSRVTLAAVELGDGEGVPQGPGRAWVASVDGLRTPAPDPVLPEVGEGLGRDAKLCQLILQSQRKELGLLTGDS